MVLSNLRIEGATMENKLIPWGIITSAAGMLLKSVSAEGKSSLTALGLAGTGLLCAWRILEMK